MRDLISRFIARSLLILGVTLGFVSTANAITYVGSWDVYSGPSWSGSPPTGPLAYTGQEAAALLFGGTAGDYTISTVDNTVANINNQAWYDVIGYGGAIHAENYFNKYLGLYYGPTSGYGFGNPNNAASALVQDNTCCGYAINYAFFTAPVPEPETYAMMLAGLGLLGLARRRKQNLST